jgi:hypothetical protein
MATFRLYLIDSAGVTSRAVAQRVAAMIEPPRRPSLPNTTTLRELREQLGMELFPDGLEWVSLTQRVAIDVESSLLDGPMLSRLLVITRRNGVHVYDEEGDVLYLADGRVDSPETTAARQPADPLAALNGVMMSPAGIRYDGVYRSLQPSAQADGEHKAQWSYVAFRPDGSMAWGGSYEEPPLVLLKHLFSGDTFVAAGRTRSDPDGTITHRVQAPWGSFSGQIEVRPPNGLFIRQARADGSRASEIEYEFLPA